MTHVLLVAIGVALAVFALTMVGQLGAVLLERDPRSVWGMRFTVIGIAARRSIHILATRSPIARAVEQSLPDSDPPPSADRTPVGPRKMPPPDTCESVYNPAGGKSLGVRCQRSRGHAGEHLCGGVSWLMLLLALTGCADLTWAREVRDASHSAAETAAPSVERWCVAQAEADRAAVLALPERSPERERLAEQAQTRQRERRCPEAVAAYSTLRVASITLDATVAAAESGQCMAARSQSCDVGGAAVKAAQAIAEMAGLVEHLEKAAGR